MASKEEVGITPQQEEEVEAFQSRIPKKHQETLAMLFSCEEEHGAQRRHCHGD